MRLRSLLSGLLLCAPVAGQVTIYPRTSYPAGNDPYGVAVLDANLDGHLDAAVSNREPDRMTVLLGDGSGALAATQAYTVGNEPTALATGDVDGDGISDLLVGNHASSDVSILLGTGAGFTGAGTIATQHGARHVVLLDYDLDGVLDLSTTPDALADIELRRGLGGGAFGAPFFAGGSFDYPMHHAAGDVDLDGAVDLVVAGEFHGPVVCVLEGDGSGGFLEGWSTWWVLDNGYARFVSMADLDGDGSQDLVVSGEGLGLWYVPEAATSYLGDGAGLFAYLDMFAKVGGDSKLGCAALVDLGGDGHLDYAQLLDNQFSAQGGLAIALGVGGGDFEDEAFDHLSGVKWGCLAAGDLTGDGRAEVLAALSTLDELAVWTELVLPVDTLPIPPSIQAVEPPLIPSLAVAGATKVELKGHGLFQTTSVRLGGVEIFDTPFPLCSVQHDGLIRCFLQPFGQIGPLLFEVTTPVGADEAVLVIEPVDPPLLKNLPPLIDPGVVFPGVSAGAGAKMQVGGLGGASTFLLGSPDLTPSSFPGLVDLDIGAAGTTLVLVATLTMPAEAWAEVLFPVSSTLVGSKLYFQAALLDPVAGTLPLDTTNVVTVTIFP